VVREGPTREVAVGARRKAAISPLLLPSASGFGAACCQASEGASRKKGAGETRGRLAGNSHPGTRVARRPERGVPAAFGDAHQGTQPSRPRKEFATSRQT
jgi:hypothetical protein